jgi:peptidoglycan biosynthesis protein MviN/MurJ (putative lipid II flippase)
MAWWLRSGPAGLAPGALQLAAAGLAAIAPMVTLGMVSALLTAWFVADRRASLTLFEAVPALVLVVVLLGGAGAAGLFWGSSLGVALQVGVLAWVLARDRALPMPSLCFDRPSWQGLARGVMLMLGAQLVYALVPLVDPLFAAHLGPGAVATLGYANRLLLGLLGLVGLALQRAALPLLAEAMVRDPRAGLRAAFRWAALAGVAGVVLALAVLAVADPVVGWLFERGRFTATDRAEVAALVQVGALQLPVLLAGLVLALALASAGGHRVILVAAVMGLVVKVAGSAWLSPAWGTRGLVVATALMYTTTAIIMAAALARRPAAPGPTT